MVNQRLNNLSKTKNDFDFVKKGYEDALENSHYESILNYTDKTDKPPIAKKKRKRKIIYFQPPFSNQVKTPIGRLFLNLVKKHFNASHPLHKILNHRCLKISYCCLNNIKSEITSHNQTLRNANDGPENKNLCNCRKKDGCPVDGKCLKTNVVYRADIRTTEGDHGIYLGTTGNIFKERYGGHKTTLKYKSKRNTTELSNFYWKLKEEGKHPDIKWSIVTEIKSGYSLKNGCTLCNTERYMIARAKEKEILNKRNERKRACPHYAKKFF